MYCLTAPVQGAFAVDLSTTSLHSIKPLRMVFDFLLIVRNFPGIAYGLSADRQLVSDLPVNIRDLLFCLPDVRSYCQRYGGHAYFKYFLYHVDAYQLETLLEQFTHHLANPFHILDRLNCFIAALREDLGSYQAGVSTGQYSYNPTQMASIQELINSAFERYSRLLVLRVDLRYQDGIPLSYVQAKDDMHRFMDSRRFNTLFDDVVGYAYKLERGVNFHFHTLWLVNGHKHQKDAYLAQCIGERWSRMTAGQGKAYICNYDKQRYRQCGIGMVHRTDSTKRELLLQAASYLCKEDPLTKAYILPNHRTFFRSVVK